jgi:hypothetical protein
MFEWSPVEMPGVSQEVTEHTLNIKPGSRLNKEGLWRFKQEKCWAIGKELSRFLAASFVKEVQHPDRVANPVLIPKMNGKW